MWSENEHECLNSYYLGQRGGRDVEEERQKKKKNECENGNITGMLKLQMKPTEVRKFKS